MNEPRKHGVPCHGLDQDFAADERRKSNLILEAQALRQQQQPDAAALKFAEAAQIEERLSEVCEANGLAEKSRVHLFSAVSCWAQAGNFHEAIVLGERLLASEAVPERLRRSVEDYVERLRSRRAQWSASLVLAATGE